MTAEIRPDFLNLRLWARRLTQAFGQSPHVLTDNFNNVISSHAKSEAPEESSVTVRGKVIAKLWAAPGNSASLLKLTEALLEAEMRALDAENSLDASRLLDHDLDSLLDLSESESLPVEELLHHLLRLLRAHVWVEKVCVFGMLDGFTIEGITALGHKGEEWKTLYSNAAGVVAAKKTPFSSESPATDPHFQGRAGAGELRNVYGVPLLHGSSLLGALTLANQIAGALSETDLRLLHRFASVAAHLLQKHIFKSRMQESERTNENLGRYLSRKVVQNVENSQELFLGGVEKKVVCLFSDIRGYTSITEGISPATLVKLLNFHFEKMHAIIERNEGTLDKIVGDLIMAVWNIPQDQPDPDLLAMRAALEMQKEMIRVVIPEWQRHGVEKVGMGIGVNSGPALAGNLGSSRFMNYTVIGDAVNTAQRLESKAKAGEVWMNEAMFPAVHGKIEKPVRREIDIRLKGKEQTINALVYRPLSA